MTNLEGMGKQQSWLNWKYNGHALRNEKKYATSDSCDYEDCLLGRGAVHSVRNLPPPSGQNGISRRVIRQITDASEEIAVSIQNVRIHIPECTTYNPRRQNYSQQSS
jgi:hypothetical protein